MTNCRWCSSGHSPASSEPHSTCASDPSGPPMVGNVSPPTFVLSDPSFPPLLLPHRSLLRLEATERGEVLDFLQGLVTCDMRRLQPEQPVWGCFLEFNGRVLADAYFYEQTASPTASSCVIWVEVESGTHAELVLEQLTEMKMRRKVKIEDVSERFAVVAECVARPGDETQGSDSSSGAAALCCTQHAIASFEDPRSAALFPPAPSSALDATESTSVETRAVTYSLKKHFLPREWCPAPLPTEAYSRLLAAHGVGEGAATFPSRKCTPFDGNADLLAEGICFDKGCYIGQELTHRTHVMLVVRKRLLPLCVSCPLTQPPDTAASVSYERMVKAMMSERSPSVELVVHRPKEPEEKGAGAGGEGVGAAAAAGSAAMMRERAGRMNTLVSLPFTSFSALSCPASASSPSSSSPIAPTTASFIATGVVRLEYVNATTQRTEGLQAALPGGDDAVDVQGWIPHWWPRKEVKKMFRKLKKK